MTLRYTPPPRRLSFETFHLLHIRDSWCVELKVLHKSATSHTQASSCRLPPPLMASEFDQLWLFDFSKCPKTRSERLTTKRAVFSVTSSEGQIDSET